MGSYRRIEGETYKCYSCGMLKLNEVEEDWTCSKCSDKVMIYAEYNGKWQLERKKAKDIVEGDIVLVRTGTHHDVFKNIIDNGKCKLRLKNFGTYTVHEDDYVDCILGSYL